MNTAVKRVIFTVLIDSVIIVFSLYTALILKFDGAIPDYFIQWFAIAAFCFIAVKTFFFYMSRFYHINWGYLGLLEILTLAKASIYSLAAEFIFALFLVKTGLPNGFIASVLIIDCIICFLIISGLRLSKRVYAGFSIVKTQQKGERVLIAGAGDAGQQIVRRMKEEKGPGFVPVGFIDDDPFKKDMAIHGVRVLGPISEIHIFARIFNVKCVIIAIPSASSVLIRRITEYSRKAGIDKIKILPSLAELIDGNVNIKHIQDVQPENLLGRQEARINTETILPYIKNKTVLVTGAGGSIGSQLCMQIAALQPLLLIMLDIGDTELFYIDKKITECFPAINRKSIIADVKDAAAVKKIFSLNRPQVVFHSAAYKHVPIMESNAREAVLNNIEGTKVVVQASVEFGAEKFIFISTDKAVNPASIMGATKRVAENLLKCLNVCKTKFVSVRFGNVLESRGSIVPIIKEEIKKGGPVTITDSRMRRYFMSIVEASYLVLQAGAIGGQGDVLVFDMGKPIKILDLAYEIIRFYGLEPDKDIPIVFTGIRPGEKLSEELLTAEENQSVTKHDKIFLAKDIDSIGPGYLEKIDILINESKSNASYERIVYLLKKLIPTYNHNNKQELK